MTKEAELFSNKADKEEKMRLNSFILLMACAFFFAANGCAVGIKNCEKANLGRYKCSSASGKVFQCAQYQNHLGFMELSKSDMHCTTNIAPCICGAGKKKVNYTSITCDPDGVKYKCTKGCRCESTEPSSGGK